MRRRGPLARAMEWEPRGRRARRAYLAAVYLVVGIPTAAAILFLGLMMATSAFAPPR